MGWNLFLLAPRMLLSRLHGQARIPPAEFERRASLLRAGEWAQLLQPERAPAGARSGPPPPDSLEARGGRAAALAHLGELSAAGTRQRGVAARTPGSRPEAVLQHQPHEPVRLSWGAFVNNLRRARRGAAPGPSGCTNEHLRLLLDSEEDMQLLHHAAQRLALADVPEVIATALRLGRMVALRKPNGRVRGLVMGDTFRRLVARTLAQQFAASFDAACRPFQFALGTRAGTEAAARVVRALCERDPRATVVSIDGVGAYDHVHRASMLGGLAGDNALAPLLPFARLFYAESSTYLWYDDAGMPHSVVQAEGGEQGDPLMPALHALGQHSALHAASATLRAVAGVARVVLQEHAGIEVHLGKTRIWNAAGEEPAGTSALQGPGGADVWVGAWTLPPERRGLVVLGTPVGHANFVQDYLQQKRAEHQRLLDRILCVPDLQAAWLLLLFWPGWVCCSCAERSCPWCTAASACVRRIASALRRIGHPGPTASRFGASAGAWGGPTGCAERRRRRAAVCGPSCSGGTAAPVGVHQAHVAGTLGRGCEPGERMAKRGHHADRRGGARHAVLRP